MFLYACKSHRMTGSHPMTKKFIFPKVNVFVYIRLGMIISEFLYLLQIYFIEIFAPNEPLRIF